MGKFISKIYRKSEVEKKITMRKGSAYKKLFNLAEKLESGVACQEIKLRVGDGCELPAYTGFLIIDIENGERETLAYDNYGVDSATNEITFSLVQEYTPSLSVPECARCIVDCGRVDITNLNIKFLLNDENSNVINKTATTVNPEAGEALLELDSSDTDIEQGKYKYSLIVEDDTGEFVVYDNAEVLVLEPCVI